MIIPIRTDYRLSGTPWVNYALIAANIVIYAAGFNGLNGEKIDTLMLWSDKPTMAGFFTYMFLHAGLMHLLGNMLFLWVFGNAINDRLGNAGYLLFYLGGGLFSAVGYLLLTGGNAPIIGASGAISAVTGAYLVLLPRSRVTLLLFFIFITAFEVSSLYFLAIQFVFELFMSVQVTFGDTPVQVAHWAHTAGYGFGIGVSALLLGVGILPRDAYDLLNMIRTWRRRERYRRMVARGYDPFSRTGGQRTRQVRARQVAGAAAPTTGARELELRKQISESLTVNDFGTAASLYMELVQVAEDAVLPRQNQLDVANQLMSEHRYPQAADAYERFLRHFVSDQRAPDIFLMLGICYGRYLHQYDRAIENLQRAEQRLRDPRKKQLAQRDLEFVRRQASG